MKTSMTLALLLIAGSAAEAQNNVPADIEPTPMPNPPSRPDTEPAPTPDAPPREVPPPALPEGPTPPTEVPPPDPDPGTAPAPTASSRVPVSGTTNVIGRQYPPCSRTVQDNCQQRERRDAVKRRPARRL